MISKTLEIKPGMIKMAGEYKKLMNYKEIQELMQALQPLKQSDNFNALKCNCPENIETGISGFFLILLELFNQTKEAEYLANLEKLAVDLIGYCRENKTNNYSLYTGRCGVVYCLMQLYGINQDENLIKECVEMVKPSGNEYLHSKYTSDYLYNGRAGTLLIITHLYILSGEFFLKEYIELFINKIISNAVLSKDGISWKSEEEVNLKNSCGFAHGVAGIKYCFSNINHYFFNPGIKYIVQQADKYMQSCWVKDFKNWGNYEKDILTPETLHSFQHFYLSKNSSLFTPGNKKGWADGIAGMLISGLSEKSETPVLSLENKSMHDEGNTLLNGATGTGLYQLEHFKKYHDKEYLQSIVQLANHFFSAGIETNAEGGLFYGNLGVVYFLLKAADIQKQSENILAPYFNHYYANREAVAEINITLPAVRKLLLAGHFRRTIIVLENIAPLTLNNYLAGKRKIKYPDEANKFLNFFDKYCDKNAGTTYQILKDVLSFEKSKYVFAHSDERSNLQVYLDEINHHNYAVKLLNNTDEWLLKQNLAISPGVKIVGTKWDWSGEDGTLMQNVTMAPGNFAYLFTISGQTRVVEYSLKIDGMVLFRFDKPKTVEQALMEIKHICNMQTEETIKIFLVNTGSRDIYDFINRLDFLVLFKIKELIYEGILHIKDPGQ